MKLKDLEKFRDSEGYIDFDKVLELYKNGKIGGFNKGLPETRGSAEKFKNWFELEDYDILIRSTMFIDEIANYTEYAELIIEELAKQVDMPCAHYDLVKVNGLKGNLSVSVLDREKENQSMQPLSQNKATSEIVGGSTISEIFENVKFYVMSQTSKGKEVIKDINKDVIKMIIFDIFTMQTDRHQGNISLIYDGEDVKLSPLYDNECSLMLDRTKLEISEILEKSEKEKNKEIGTLSNLQENVIDLDYEDRRKEYTPWEDMLYYLTDDIEFAMEFTEKCFKNLNIEKAIKNVEKRIGAEIPIEAKEFCIKGFKSRKKDIANGLILDMDEEIGGINENEDNDEHSI